MSALKGMVTNDATPSRVALCKPQWLYIAFGSYCWEKNADGTPKFDWGGIPYAVRHDSTAPNPYNISLAMTHPSYAKWHILGMNEADIAGAPPFTPIKPQVYVDLCVMQIEQIVQADVDAKFVIWGGTQHHPLFEENGWFGKVWQRFPVEHKEKVKAIGTDYYVQGAGIGGYSHDPSKWLKKLPLDWYFSQCHSYLKAREPRLRLWCFEIGLAEHADLDLNAAATYPQKVQAALNKYCARWAWYVMTPHSTYLSLLRGDTLTAVGQTFAAL